MNKFIGLNLVHLDGQDNVKRIGSVLLNVEYIISIEAHGPPREDSVCRIRVLNDKLPFIVEGSMIDLLDVMKRSGADFHAFDNSKLATKMGQQRVKEH
jgi:hypothetical protein